LDSIIDRENPYFHLYERFILRHPFTCKACGAERNASVASCYFEIEKEWFQIDIGCHACGHRWTSGPWNLEEIRMIAKAYTREKTYDWGFVWEIFCMCQTYPGLIPNSQLVKYSTWRNIITKQAKSANWFEAIRRRIWTH
jgi:hypothetical protein